MSPLITPEQKAKETRWSEPLNDAALLQTDVFFELRMNLAILEERTARLSFMAGELAGAIQQKAHVLS